MKRVRQLGIIIFPISVMAFAAVCWIVILITGRPLLNDIGSLVDFGLSTLRILTWLLVTLAAQYCFIGFRTKACTAGDECSKPPLKDDYFDLIASIILLVITGYAYANWF